MPYLGTQPYLIRRAVRIQLCEYTVIPNTCDGPGADDIWYKFEEADKAIATRLAVVMGGQWPQDLFLSFYSSRFSEVKGSGRSPDASPAA